MQDKVVSAVREFIADNFLYREGIATLKDDTSFLSTGIIDSTGVLELVLFLETTFGFKVDDEEVVPENLDSIRAICAYVGRKVQTVAA
jgi:acyl carrier protein